MDGTGWPEDVVLEVWLVVEFVKDLFQDLVFLLKTLIYSYFLGQSHIFSSDVKYHQYERRSWTEQSWDLRMWPVEKVIHDQWEKESYLIALKKEDMHI